jgi:hypothetical protein
MISDSGLAPRAWPAAGGTPRRRRRRLSLRGTREAKGLAGRVSGSFLYHFAVELDDRLTEDVQYGGPAGGEVIVPTPPFSIADCSF